jgi:hypothetical protein
VKNEKLENAFGKYVNNFSLLFYVSELEAL